MNEIIIIIICLIFLILSKFALNVDFSKIKSLKDRKNENLNNISKKYPKDEQICKSILKTLNNEDVKIEVKEDYNSCLYTVFNNTITIGKFKQDYMKIQTIAHECVHSCQNKISLWFNFIISNIQNIYFLITIILIFFNKLPNTYIFLEIFIMICILKYIVRSNLETDAMTIAPYIAEKYIEDNKIITEDEKDELMNEYKYINSFGISFTNYTLIIQNIIRIIIFCIVCLI